MTYICEGIFDLHIYVTVTSPYPQDRGIKELHENPYGRKPQRKRKIPLSMATTGGVLWSARNSGFRSILSLSRWKESTIYTGSVCR